MLLRFVTFISTATMLSLLIALLAISPATPTTSQIKEDEYYDVAHTLEIYGVDASKLLLDGLWKRTLESSCTIAVCTTRHTVLQFLTVKQCEALGTVYGDQLIRPDEPSYVNFSSSFWSQQQADRTPSCVFEAPTASSVSVAVLISRLTHCPFAARSGGHAAFEDASNIEGGVTISLEQLNDVSLSSDRRTATIGAGNRWHRVYSALAEYDLAVIGGRAASIGVGGLTTGGGISFFSNLYGWACDNVASYDVVLASGRQVNASPSSHADLYWALRGGGNNFGLVVSFDMFTIPLPKNEIWSSVRTYISPSFSSVAQAFYNTIVNSPTDPNSGLWVAWLRNEGTQLASATLWYAKPDGNTSVIFNDFHTITPIAESTRNVRLADFTAEVDSNNPYDLRESYYDLTVKADPELANLAKDIFYEELPTTDAVKGAQPIMLYQGITSGQILAMAKRGGNPLGLNDPEEPLFLIHIGCWWDLESDDDTIYAFASRVLQRIKDEAEKRGKASKFLYMNYSSKFEDVIASYGKENKDRLKAVARRYDPQGVFQKLQPGYFKLDGPPVRDERYFSG